MLHKRLGVADLMIPEIGLGTWQHRGGAQALRKGIELGATFIDTAEAYGTESLVGEVIRDIRNQVFLATKVSPWHFRRKDLFEAADRSLQALKTDYVDLYQLHWPNSTIPIEETMGAMEELVNQGKIRCIGVSNFSVGELQRAQAALSQSRIVSNQVRYNLVDRTAEVGLLEHCQRNKITLIAYSPLARGMHAVRKNDPLGILRKIAAATGKTEAQVALNWCIAKDNVVAIPKADSPEHVEENCGASDWRLASDQVALLDKEIRYRQRGRVEAALRRLARNTLQRLGRI
jgi:diketogulonate reductase-like aldo/keto reductase